MNLLCQQGNEAPETSQEFVDPWLAKVNRYKELGYSEQDVLIALAAVDQDNDNEVQKTPDTILDAQTKSEWITCFLGG